MSNIGYFTKKELLEAWRTKKFLILLLAFVISLGLTVILVLAAVVILKKKKL